MKMFQSLSSQIEQLRLHLQRPCASLGRVRQHLESHNAWWRMYVTDASRKSCSQVPRKPSPAAVLGGRSSVPGQAEGDAQSSPVNLRSPAGTIPVSTSPIVTRSPWLRHSHPPLIVFAAVTSLTSAIGYQFYNAPRLHVGAIAPQTIRAPGAANVEDTRTTEERRKEARTGSVPVLMIDTAANQKVLQDLQRLLDRANELRQIGGPFPFVNTAILSTPTQFYLRQVEDSEWQAMLSEVDKMSALQNDPSGRSRANSVNSAHSAAANSRGGVTSATRSPDSAASAPIDWSFTQSRAIAELHSYRRSADPMAYAAAIREVDMARLRYPQALAALSGPSFPELEVFSNPALLELPDPVWQSTRIGIRYAVERILAQGIHAGLPRTHLKQAVKLQLRESIPTAAESLASQIVLAVLQPNLVRDQEKTRLRAEQAALDVKPVIVIVQQGEVIVEAGETISQPQFVLLDHFGLSRRGMNWQAILGVGGLVSGAILGFWLIEHYFHPGLRRRDHLLVLLLTLSAPLMSIVGLTTSLPAIGLLVGSFYGSVLGVTVVSLLTLILPVGLPLSVSSLLSSAAGGLVGGVIAGRLRSREELALLGGAVGLTQGVVYLILSTVSGSAWYVILGTAALHGLAGLAWSVVALGLSPYLEHLFDLVTPIRLAELANPNRPLLKRLAAEAPGTFQHTLFVASLAEAAARVLGCNVELVRAGTLYHDIGKMHDPLGFIENQMGGTNKHDTMNHPWESAALIKKHVTEGLVMARKHRLPKAIQAFIPEHQGTMLIAYFYHQAQQQAQAQGEPPVSEADFRYDGPIPQSRETGIVMLADSCEAALRSLKDATAEDALTMINKILRARWQDQQLVDSDLTREEMNQIAEVFVQVWQQFNHQRIAYPKAIATPQPSA